MTDAQLTCTQIQELVAALPKWVKELDFSGNNLNQISATTFNSITIDFLRLDNTNLKKLLDSIHSKISEI